MNRLQHKINENTKNQHVVLCLAIEPRHTFIHTFIYYSIEGANKKNMKEPNLLYSITIYILIIYGLPTRTEFN